MPGGDSHRGKSLKLLEKIPEDAEATVVLVGKEGGGLGLLGVWVSFHCGLLVLCSGLQATSSIPGQPPNLYLLFLTACLAPSSFFLSPLPASRPVFCRLGLPLVCTALLGELKRSTLS